MRQKFTDKERDAETGLDYMQARYYASVMGRFTSIDPYDINLERQTIADAKEANSVFKEYLANPQHWNHYVYVLNNPLKYVDPDGLAEKLTVNLNIVYDKSLTEEEAKKLLAAQIADLKKVYGPLDIEFNITYTAGSANSDKSAITEGAKDGAVNVFFSQDKNTFHNEGVTRPNGQIFVTMGADQRGSPISNGALSHEMGHKFGMVWDFLKIPFTDVTLGNLYSDFHIETSNAKLRRGGANEGENWVDDYRKVSGVYIGVTQGGEVHRRVVPRQPTTFDIYRVGARTLAGK